MKFCQKYPGMVVGEKEAVLDSSQGPSGYEQES
jgi:hypothetical protein